MACGSRCDSRAGANAVLGFILAYGGDQPTASLLKGAYDPETEVLLAVLWMHQMSNWKRKGGMLAPDRRFCVDREPRLFTA